MIKFNIKKYIYIYIQPTIQLDSQKGYNFITFSIEFINLLVS